LDENRRSEGNGFAEGKTTLLKRRKRGVTGILR
jgi:hypothetical protein